jgi:hypothetical protein
LTGIERNTLTCHIPSMKDDITPINPNASPTSPGWVVKVTMPDEDYTVWHAFISDKADAVDAVKKRVSKKARVEIWEDYPIDLFLHAKMKPGQVEQA